MKKSKLIILRIACVLLSLTFVLLAYVAYCRLVNELPSLLGYNVIKITDNSMDGKFTSGDYILVKDVGIDRINVGDTVTFFSTDRNTYLQITTHDVVEVGKNTVGTMLVTKGLTSEKNDSTNTYENNFIGKYVKKLPVLTRILDFMSASLIVFILIVLNLAGWILVMLPLIQYKIDMSYKAEGGLSDEENFAQLVKEELEKLREAEKSNKEDE